MFRVREPETNVTTHSHTLSLTREFTFTYSGDPQVRKQKKPRSHRDETHRYLSRLVAVATAPAVSGEQHATPGHQGRSSQRMRLRLLTPRMHHSTLHGQSHHRYCNADIEFRMVMRSYLDRTSGSLSVAEDGFRFDFMCLIWRL